MYADLTSALIMARKQCDEYLTEQLAVDSIDRESIISGTDKTTTVKSTQQNVNDIVPFCEHTSTIIPEPITKKAKFVDI